MLTGVYMELGSSGDVMNCIEPKSDPQTRTPAPQIRQHIKPDHQASALVKERRGSQ
jgi:hypothetical protein